MGGLGFLVLMIIVGIAGLTLMSIGIITIVISKKIKKKERESVKLRIFFIVLLLIGLILVGIPTVFFSVIGYTNHTIAQYNKTIEGASDRGDYARVIELLSEGVNPDETFKGGTFTPLMHTVVNGNFELAKLLIEKGSNINSENIGNDGLDMGYTPIFYAFEHYDLIKLLVMNGADVNHKAKDGVTPLIRVIRMNNFDSIKLLVESGADVNSVDATGNSVLGYACNPEFNYANYSIIKYLLDNGADPKYKTPSGENAIDLVRKNETWVQQNDVSLKTQNSGVHLSGLDKDNFKKIYEILTSIIYK